MSMTMLLVLLLLLLVSQGVCLSDSVEVAEGGHRAHGLYRGVSVGVGVRVGVGVGAELLVQVVLHGVWMVRVLEQRGVD